MSDKITLPKAKITHVESGPVAATMKAAEAKTGKVYLVPVDKIKVIPGFNVRVETPDYIAHRDEIATSIAANGFNQKKPLSGYVGKDGEENVIYVTDGHTRLSAVRAYNAEADEPITHVPVLVAPENSEITDLLVELHTANTGRKLTPFEQGILAKRLILEGLDKKEIARRLGFTTRYLDDVLLLADADSSVKRHVASGQVSSTMAIQLLRSDAEHAAEKIDAAVAKASKTGKKATKKMTGPKMTSVKVSFNYAAEQDMKEIVKAAAAAIREAIPQTEDDDGNKYSDVSGVIQVTVQIPAPPKAEKPAKAKAEKPAKAKAEKPAKAKAEKPAKAKAEESDIGIPGAVAAGEDDVIAKLPPKVESDPDVPDDEEIDI